MVTFPFLSAFIPADTWSLALSLLKSTFPDCPARGLGYSSPSFTTTQYRVPASFRLAYSPTEVAFTLFTVGLVLKRGGVPSTVVKDTFLTAELCPPSTSVSHRYRS